MDTLSCSVKQLPAIIESAGKGLFYCREKLKYLVAIKELLKTVFHFSLGRTLAIIMASKNCNTDQSNNYSLPNYFG